MKVFVIPALLAAVLLTFGVECQHNPHWVDGHNTIVHLFEWKWDDIADECERFLGPKGYGGVQVSPVSENSVIPERPWWERYQPVSFKLITRSGNEQQFANMVRRCNNAGVRIYVDALPNHMAAAQSWQVNGTGGSLADPENQSFPAVPLTKEDFHAPCVLNAWDNIVNIRNCELLGLKDIDQSKPNARVQLIDFLSRLIDLGVAGFRIDAAKHMWPEDLKYIYAALPNLSTDHGFASGSRALIYQEVIDHMNGVISKYEYTDLGLITEFWYSAEVGRAFSGHHGISHVMGIESWPLAPSKDCLIFVDNHDNQRGHGTDPALTYKETRQYNMATAFKLAYPYGVTRIMSSFDFPNTNQGTEQGPPADSNENIISPTINPDGSCGSGWVCEHRWRNMYAMVEFKNVVKDAPVTNWWSNGGNQMSLCRGNRGFVAFNGEGDLNTSLQTCLPAGTYCDVITGQNVGGSCSGRTVQVGGDGNAQIIIGGGDNDGVLAIHIGASSKL